MIAGGRGSRVVMAMNSRSSNREFETWCGRGSLVVKVTDLWPACREFEPITAESPPCWRVSERILMSPCSATRGLLGDGPRHFKPWSSDEDDT
ncbi:hypothetical protein TNCV_3628021 [Trichonephila clavipes]|nr:hypothetical protein TNCV_3628021 [Trichonephila clavipes]